MIDIHMHVIPGVDDGSKNIVESLKMIDAAIEQGVTHIVATPHSYAFNYMQYHAVLDSFVRLNNYVDRMQIPIVLMKGTEIACYCESANDVINKLNKGVYWSMNDSKYVLVEFNPFGYTSDKYARDYIEMIHDAGYLPVIAHAERYPLVSLDTLQYVIDINGIVQINAYSIVNESNVQTRERARLLLDRHIVGALGSDAHRLNHRPPIVKDGVKYIKENYEAEYVRYVLYKNVKEKIFGEE